MKRFFLFFLALVPLVFGAFKVSDRVAFDRAAWLADFNQLKHETEHNYANLKWAGPAKQVDLAALNQATLAALAQAHSNSQARAAIATFLAGFKDGHLHIESGPPRPVAALMDLLPAGNAPAIAFQMSGVEACEALGFKSKRHSLAISHPGLNTDASKVFAAGTLTIPDGRSFGIIRIPLFNQYDYGDSCEAAWAAIKPGHVGSCDQECPDYFEHAAKLEVAAQFAREARQLTRNASGGLIIDLTGNGGGTEWADYAAVALTPNKLKAPRVAFVRGEHWARAFQSDIDEFTRTAARDTLAAADLTLARALQDSARVSCDLASIWTRQAGQPHCWNVVMQTPYKSDAYALELRQPHPYSGKVYIMVDKNTASASELFAAVLQDNGVARVIGTRTFGAGCGYTNGGIDVTLKHSGLKIRMPDCARIRANGANEYEGIIPDLPVDWGDSDASRGAALVQALQSMLPGA
jgi:hypothetical protein